MEMFNRAFGDADAFAKMLQKVQRNDTELRQELRNVEPEVVVWNAEVKRKRDEKKARKAQHVKALNGLR